LSLCGVSVNAVVALPALGVAEQGAMREAFARLKGDVGAAANQVRDLQS
jgi:hypothetical protein